MLNKKVYINFSIYYYVIGVKTGKKVLAVVIIAILVIAGVATFYYLEERKKEDGEDEEVAVKETYIPPIGVELLTFEYSFSEPEIVENGDYVNVYIDEADFNDIHDGWPVIPVKTATYEFPFGTKILNVSYHYSDPENITLSKKISVGSCSTAT